MSNILPLRPGYQLLAMSAVSKIVANVHPEAADELLCDDEKQALFTLCDDIKAAREYIEQAESIHPFGSLEESRCSQLALHTWRTLDNEAKRLELLELDDERYKKKLFAFFQTWEERFAGWRDASKWCFETHPRTVDILMFLMRWHLMDLSVSDYTSRGCADWLKKNGFIPLDAKTLFDHGLKKTLVL